MSDVVEFDCQKAFDFASWSTRANLSAGGRPEIRRS
jgi:hypothetical protein